MGGRLVEGTTDGPMDDDRTLLDDAVRADDDRARYGEHGRLRVDDRACTSTIALAR